MADDVPLRHQPRPGRRLGAGVAGKALPALLLPLPLPLWRFYSANYRLFKITELETECEDCGQEVHYRGTVTHHPHRFVLDKHRSIETGRLFPVCGNTWRMLHDTQDHAVAKLQNVITQGREGSTSAPNCIGSSTVRRLRYRS